MIELCLADGSLSIVFGTTALLSDRGVIFKQLTLAVVDEQHRFVLIKEQRCAKKDKA